MSTLKEKSRSEETAKEPSKKLGVKYLDDVQLTNSFPDWKALMQRIEEQRSIANSTPKEFSIVSKIVFRRCMTTSTPSWGAEEPEKAPWC